jgi:hypothetical protein
VESHALAIFETREDHFNWDKYEQQSDLIEPLSDANKHRAKTGIRYLRVLLGEDFLQRAAEDGNSILAWYFLNAAPCARLSLIQLVEELRALEGAPNFNGLVARLKDGRKAEEALTVLDAAYKFSRVGFQVSFDPKHTNAGHKHIPDLKLFDCDSAEEVFVEVSRLRKGGHRELDSRTYHIVFQAVQNAISACPGAWDFDKPRVLPCVRVRVLKGLGDKDLIEVIGELRRLILEVPTINEYQEFTFKDAVEAAISPAHDHSKAKAWAAARKMRDNDLVEGPLIPLNEIPKARAKIVAELEQLPPDKPGVIVIPADESLLPWMYDPQEIVLGLAEELAFHPTLLCAMISHSFRAGELDPFVAKLGQHAFVRTEKPGFVTEHSIIVMNEAFGLPIAAGTLAKVRHAYFPPEAIGLRGA